MVTQKDVDQIEKDLNELRSLLMTARERVRPRLDELVERTEQLQAQGDGSVFLPTINNVHELLLAFKRGFEVSDRMRSLGKPKARYAG